MELDDENQRIIGSETIAYHNQSPDVLRYLWVQLDANLFSSESDSWSAAEAPAMNGLSFQALRGVLYREKFDGGLAITKVATADGEDLPHTIVQTMMRVDLPKPLGPGESMEFVVDWSYSLVDAKRGSRAVGIRVFSGGWEFHLCGGAVVSADGGLYGRPRMAS